jgi:ribosomal protein S18 acetylase RimI-like enzyme
MIGNSRIARVSWDCSVLGQDAFELVDAERDTIAQVSAPGHYTVKVDPLASKEILHRNGFYYCDTLIEPYCAAARIRQFPHEAAGFDRRPALDPLLAICRSAFRHGRFHRDFNVEHRLANLRYENWLTSLQRAGQVYGLTWQGELAGFIAHDRAKLVLHALGEAHRGRGLAKHLWTVVCGDLAMNGVEEISSSISTVNVAALGLYAALGFRFRNPVDVYHRMIP